MSKKITACIFCLFLAAFFLLFLLTPDKKFSEEENRYLQTLPALNFDRLFSGRFSREFEEYAKDQFPLREAFLPVKAASELLRGQRENNGVFLAGEGYAFPDAPDPGEREKNIEALKSFAKSVDLPVTVCLIPGQGEILKDRLPEFVYTKELYRDTISLLQSELPNCEVLDLYDEFLEAAEDRQIYFKTDHHFNTLGAYLAYAELIRSMGMEPILEEAFTKTAVSEEFYGTMYSKSGFRWLLPDTIERWDLPDDKFSLWIADDDTRNESLYFPENLLKKDQYTYFLGGNHALEIIENESKAEELLLVKDSFAHIAAPFLARHFGKTHLLDLRYYKGEVSEYAEKEGIGRIVIFYSLSEFLEAKSLSTLR